MSILFEPTPLGPLTLSNRIVRSATGEGMSDDEGTPRPDMIELYRRLAEGRVGLIITGHAFVSPEGRANRGMAGIWKDEQIPRWKEIVNAVHSADSKIAIQLNHAGRQADPEAIGGQPVAPSPVTNRTNGVTPRELRSDEIEKIIEAFAQAARRAKDAGFDGVQIHCAHGYLLSEFISPYTNRRNDEWGGTLEGRAACVLKVYERIRATVGREMLVFIKLNAVDFIEGGLTIEQSSAIAAMLKNAGIDAVEISAGMAETSDKIVRKAILKPEQEAYFRDYARAFRKTVGDLPLMLVGGIRSKTVAEELLGSNDADFISMCRPFIREPDLVRKWMKGVSDRAECTSCNQCKSGRDGGMLRCGRDL